MRLRATCSRFIRPGKLTRTFAGLAINASTWVVSMFILGIPDDHIERIHWYLGPGKGSEYGFKHVPSGIMVGGKCPPNMTVFQFHQKVFADFVEKLKAAGIVKDKSTGE